MSGEAGSRRDAAGWSISGWTLVGQAPRRCRLPRLSWRWTSSESSLERARWLGQLQWLPHHEAAAGFQADSSSGTWVGVHSLAVDLLDRRPLSSTGGSTGILLPGFSSSKLARSGILAAWLSMAEA